MVSRISYVFHRFEFYILHEKLFEKKSDLMLKHAGKNIHNFSVHTNNGFKNI